MKVKDIMTESLIVEAIMTGVSGQKIYDQKNNFTMNAVIVSPCHAVTVSPCHAATLCHVA